MNRNEFFEYILDNYLINGDAARMLDNILKFVENNYPDENDQYRVLCELLDGTIGLSDREIRKAAF